MSQVYTYTVHIEPADEGGYVAVVPALNDAATQGESFEEAVEMAKDLIRGYLEIFTMEGREIPTEACPLSTTVVSVALKDNAQLA